MNQRIFRCPFLTTLALKASLSVANDVEGCPNAGKCSPPDQIKSTEIIEQIKEDSDAPENNQN